jgi:hypothetical protein
MKKSKLKTYKKSALCSAILGAMGSAHAATIAVDGSCSLVEAMQAANSDLPVGTCGAGSGSDVIQVVTPVSNITISTIFEASVDGPGSAGLPVVTSNITIEGNGLTVKANNSTDNFRLFDVATTGDLTLRDTTVTNANDGYGIGSGLFSYGGRVTIENSTFALNNGGVFIGGSYGNEINNSVIRHNTNQGSYAAGLQTLFAEVNVNATSIIDNSHGSVDNIARGVPPISGGVGTIQSLVTFTNSTLSGNRSIYGGAMLITDSSPAPLPSNLERFGNGPMRGSIGSEITIINSTVTNNQAFIGAGILEIGGNTTLTLQGSIVAGNQTISGGYAPNIFSFGSGTINLDANNIIGDNNNTGSINVTLGASDSSFSNYAKDNLYPLTLANGQLMHPLKVGSTAIDGNDLSCFGSVTDQEGKGRGKDGDDDGSFICDVGSFEHTLPIIADDAPCTFSNALLSAENDSSVGGCQPGNGHDIIVLSDNSTLTFNSVVDQVDSGYGYTFGIPRIETAITIEGNGSVIERDTASLESFDLFYIEAGGQLNLIDAHVTGANGALGAVTAWFGGNMNIIDSNISGNQSAGIFDILSINSSVTNTTVSQNAPTVYGAAISFSPLTTLQSVGFELRQSTISGNTGGTGAGVDFRGVTLASMDNTTVSGNSASYIGGLIISQNYNYYGATKVATIRNSTITGNIGASAGGIYSASPAVPGLLSMSHSMVSGNVLTPPPPPRVARNNEFMAQLALPGNNILGGGPTPIEIFSTTPYLTLDANNIIGQNGDAGTVGAIIGASDIVPAGATSTVIETTLADNGGDTLTHLPVSGGAAVDGGTPFCGLNEDQLGRIRPWDGDGDSTELCDIGSVELGSIEASDLIFKDGFDATIIIRRAKIMD